MLIFLAVLALTNFAISTPETGSIQTKWKSLMAILKETPETLTAKRKNNAKIIIKKLPIQVLNQELKL